MSGKRTRIRGTETGFQLRPVIAIITVQAQTRLLPEMLTHLTWMNVIEFKYFSANEVWSHIHKPKGSAFKIKDTLPLLRPRATVLDPPLHDSHVQSSTAEHASPHRNKEASHTLWLRILPAACVTAPSSFQCSSWHGAQTQVETQASTLKAPPTESITNELAGARGLHRLLGKRRLKDHYSQTAPL